MKTCSKCTKEKPLEEYFRSKRASDGRESSCKDCTSARLKKWYEDNHEEAKEARRKSYHQNKDLDKIKWRNIRRRYGLSQSEYEQLILAGCAVCGSYEVLSVDHDHSCCAGKETCGNCIRGVLCRKHNMADGMFDSVEQIEKYLEYRKGYTQNG